MKRLSYISILVFALSCGHEGKQTKALDTFHSEEFGWTIPIPEDFTAVSAGEWEALQNKGATAVEKTFGERVDDRARTIFVFRNGSYNYLESNYQTFDPETDGDYGQSFRAVNEIVYETFAAQIPNAQIDTASSVENISGLDFRTFSVTLDLPNGVKLHSLMYARLFGKKDFSVNITYTDVEQGNQMLEAWRSSTFD